MMRAAAWHFRNPRALEACGYIPSFVSPDDPRPLKEQLHTAYAHGGGWRKFEGFKLHIGKSPLDMQLNYPGDPAMRALGWCKVRNETLVVFEHAWVAIVQEDGSHEIARMD